MTSRTEAQKFATASKKLARDIAAYAAGMDADRPAHLYRAVDRLCSAVFPAAPTAPDEIHQEALALEIMHGLASALRAAIGPAREQATQNYHAENRRQFEAARDARDAGMSDYERAYQAEMRAYLATR